MENTKITAGTVARTAVLGLGLANMLLNATGHSILPIESEQLETFITNTWVVGASLWAWWKNNSFTKNAVKADNYLEELNKMSK